jgi:ABC-type dipeptide/oligopeptide/nickel transport system ATPase subunit
LILDESIASLDCITKNKIIALLLQEVLSERGMTVLFVSHDLRDIDVIYRTILKRSKKQKIHNIFEHYEMFNGGLYRVETGFTEYRENLNKRKANAYVDLKNNRRLKLRLRTAADLTGGTEDENMVQ